MKSRISKDPNNHRWTKDTTTFGHRILRSQGWTPGSFLGPEDAPHASLHSAASASYIRVSMKDDAGGLGYRAGGGGDDDIAGMDEVKSIFDRLNGVVESEEAKRQRERKKALVHLGQRIGGVTFVRGGLLVQDGLDMVEANEKERVEALGGKGKRKAEGSAEAPKKKRRKDDEGREERKRRKEEKRKRKARSTEEEAANATASEEEAKPRKSKKSKRDKSASETPADTEEEPRKDKKRSTSKGADTPPDSDEAPRKSKKSKSETPPDSTSDTSKRDKKKEKKERKEKKREKRGKKERLKAARSSPEDDSSDTGTPGSGTPGTSTPTSGPGVRHFHHARRVAAKRSAMSDAAALRQILAI